jgi:hypothetical protein
LRLDDRHDNDDQQEDDTQRYDGGPLFMIGHEMRVTSGAQRRGLGENDENVPWHFATTSSCERG